MKRLSSSKAKRALESLIIRRLGLKRGIDDVEVIFYPVWVASDVYEEYDVKVKATFADGKGHTIPLSIRHKTARIYRAPFSQQKQLSYARLLRLMFDLLKQGYVFEIGDVVLLSEKDTLESMLIEMELEDR